ncbi:MAG: hypothetical protein AMXMBFR16_12950 [Candidatus Uhrbacteria bacterium]
MLSIRVFYSVLIYGALIISVAKADEFAIDGLSLGLSSEQVRQILGVPTEVVTPESSGILSGAEKGRLEAYVYVYPNTRVAFSNENHVIAVDGVSLCRVEEPSSAIKTGCSYTEVRDFLGTPDAEDRGLTDPAAVLLTYRKFSLEVRMFRDSAFSFLLKSQIGLSEQ